MSYARLVKPLLFLLPAEAAHRVAFGALRLALAVAPLRALVARRLARPDPALETHALGTTFASPVGLAAGFDKDGVGLEAVGALGFGFVEVGTITAEPQPGNPGPRLFRLERDRALVNRLGFNGAGSERARGRLAAWRARAARRPGVLGVNIGRTKAATDAIADYGTSMGRLAPLADYVTVNVSSPNTPGLRDLQAVEQLRPLLASLRAAHPDVPLLVKIAPDLADEDVDAVADLALELGLAGIVATNTTTARTGLVTPAADVAAMGPGGLSGAPLRPRALAVVRRLRARVGDRLVIVAAGGIEDASDAWERIAAGATLVQLYTGFVFGGPRTAAQIGAGLVARARAEGFARVQDAVGVETSSNGSGRSP